MNTIKIYRNYGCLAAEKRIIYTYGCPAATASCYDEITVLVPNWEIYESETGTMCAVSPWKETYTINELLAGDEQPYFIAYEREGKLQLTELIIVEHAMN